MSGYKISQTSADNLDGYIAYSIVSLDHKIAFRNLGYKRRASKLQNA